MIHRTVLQPVTHTLYTIVSSIVLNIIETNFRTNVRFRILVRHGRLSEKLISVVGQMSASDKCPRRTNVLESKKSSTVQKKLEFDIKSSTFKVNLDVIVVNASGLRNSYMNCYPFLAYAPNLIDFGPLIGQISIFLNVTNFIWKVNLNYIFSQSYSSISVEYFLTEWSDHCLLVA